MEKRVLYSATHTLLQPATNNATLEQEQAPLDLAHIERQLIPLLNWVRKMQGKKPVIVPKG